MKNNYTFTKEINEKPTSCKKCGGKIKWSDFVMTSDPPIFSYYCEKCDKWFHWRPYNFIGILSEEKKIG